MKLFPHGKSGNPKIPILHAKQIPEKVQTDDKCCNDVDLEIKLWLTNKKIYIPRIYTDKSYSIIA